MVKIIAEHLLHLIIVLPILLLALKNRKTETFKIVLIFSIFYLVNGILLYLPLEFEQLRFFTGKWNWTGKIFALLGSILFLVVYKKFDLKDYHLTFKQDKRFLKKGVFIVLLILFLQSIYTYIFNTPKECNYETILFQLTLPGIDEEIAFRGIMLGLLMKITKSDFKYNIHPAILITALLFGMTHGLVLNNSFEIIFKSFPFFNTMILGMIWAWITLKSRSILLALMSHNLGNVTIALISMS